MIKNWIKAVFLVIMMLSVALMFDFILAAVVMWIWNLIIPFIFTGVTALTYWQSFGLCALISLFRVSYNVNDKNS